MKIFKELTKIPLAEQEFASLAEESEIRSVILGPEDAEYFWAVDLLRDEPPWRVLLRHPDYYIEPSVYQFHNRAVAVGLLEEYYLLAAAKVLKRHKLPCTFFEIIFADESRVIVLHEIGFTCLTLGGKVIWEKAIDLMGSWRIEKNLLSCKTFDGDEGVIDIEKENHRMRGPLRRIPAMPDLGRILLGIRRDSKAR